MSMVNNYGISKNKYLLLLSLIFLFVFFIDISVIITCPINQSLNSNINVPIENFPKWLLNLNFWIINFENIVYSAIVLFLSILFGKLYFNRNIIETSFQYMKIIGFSLFLSTLFSMFIIPGLKYGNLGVVPGNRFGFVLHYEFDIKTMTLGIIGAFLILASRVNKKIKSELESFV